MTGRNTYLSDLLAEVRAEVPIADQKASVILAGIGIGSGALLGGLLAGDWSPTQLHGASEPFWWLGAALLGAAIVSASLAVWPRFAPGPAGHPLMYWGQVASYRSKAAFLAAASAPLPHPEDRVADQLWELSRLVRLKYLAVRVALCLLAAAIAAFLLSAVLP